MLDTAEIFVQAGKGGDGKVSFLRLKFMPKGGPDGGDGGEGGSVYLVGDKDINTLRMFASKQKFLADPGGDGGKRDMHGKNAEHLYIKVPVGTVISAIAQDGNKYQLGEIVSHEQKLLIARGGHGGRGNAQFKSSIQTTPMFAEPGTKGDDKNLFLELKLLADVGFVGLPNGGKSTLLSVLTKATPEIGNYPFTTLFPNLGVMEKEGKTMVLADIPGLIEGASEGKGLGQDFLRHIDRCKVLVFVLFIDETTLFSDLSLDEKANSLKDQYDMLKKELESHRTGLEKKPSLIVVNKIDIYPKELIEKIEKVFDGASVQISAAAHIGLENLKDKIFDIIV